MTTPLPEPVLSQKYHHDPRYDIAYFTADQLRAYGAAEYKRGIEDAANCYSPDDSATDWMDKIRKLGETP